MSRLVATALLPALALALGAGCGGPKEQAPPEPSPEQYMQMWLQLAQVPDMQNLDAPTAMAITERLVASDNLDLIFAVLADKQARPLAKVLAVICITPFVKPDMAPRFAALTAPEHDQTTRQCATHLLGLLNVPESLPRLRELCNDPDERVRITARISLLLRRDPDTLAAVGQLWADPTVTARDREEIVLALPEEMAEEHIDLYAEALLDPKVADSARVRCATLLGHVGGPDVLPALEQASREDADPGVREIALAGIEAIHARHGAPAEPAS